MIVELNGAEPWLRRCDACLILRVVTTKHNTSPQHIIANTNLADWFPQSFHYNSKDKLSCIPAIYHNAVCIVYCDILCTRMASLFGIIARWYFNYFQVSLLRVSLARCKLLQANADWREGRTGEVCQDPLSWGIITVSPRHAPVTIRSLGGRSTLTIF